MHVAFMNLSAGDPKLSYAGGRRPRFSVVTPNLNQGIYLRRTIESVISNLEKGDEYFIIDGGSTDTSIAIIREFATAVTSWISEKDSGQYDAIAKGFDLAHGDFLCWVNSGDLLLPGALAAAREILHNSNLDLIYGDDIYIDEADRVISHSRANVDDLHYMMLYGEWTPLQDACFWRRSLYEEVKGLDRKLRYAGDFDFFLRASYHGRCRYIPMVMSAFRAHPNQHSVDFASRYSVERRRVIETLKRNGKESAILWICLEVRYWFSVHWRTWVVQRFQRSYLDWRLPCDRRGTIYSLLAAVLGARRRFSVENIASMGGGGYEWLKQGKGQS